MKLLVVWNAILTILLIVALASGGGTRDPRYDNLHTQVEANKNAIGSLHTQVEANQEITKGAFIAVGETLVEFEEFVNQNREAMEANRNAIAEMAAIAADTFTASGEYQEYLRNCTELNREAIIQISEYLEQQGGDIDELRILLQILAGL
ncbi:MAG TPA: hypothetical protein VMX96_00310 [Dehalococcoidia bacterium]|nr:hypothetical protein [Dehalococcoidia bacterium]